MANKVEETLASSLDSVSAVFEARGACVHNISVNGTYVGSVYLEKSFDSGSTWNVCNVFSNTNDIQTLICREIEAKIQYRFRFAIYTSGSPNVRISEGGRF